MKLGFEYFIDPLTPSDETWKSDLRVTPFPRKFFSVKLPPITPPSVPYPAPKDISPVGCSSTEIFNIFVFGLLPFKISESTFLNIPKDLILLIDLLWSNSLYGSPSSTINLFRTTSSIVLKFPKIFTFST